MPDLPSQPGFVTDAELCQQYWDGLDADEQAFHDILDDRRKRSSMPCGECGECTDCLANRYG